MRLRVMAAFHTALRKGEILDVQLKHIEFKPMKVSVDAEVEPGLFRREERDVIAIELPPANTKGGKTVGEPEFVYVSDPALIHALTRRRFELRSNGDAYVFGTKDGRRVKGFRRMWTELFSLVGLDWGRDKGIVWHTTRHEGISRALEASGGDILVAQQYARHRDRRTTEGYTHVRPERVLATVARLGNRARVAQ
jgi:integrase